MTPQSQSARPDHRTASASRIVRKSPPTPRADLAGVSLLPFMSMVRRVTSAPHPVGATITMSFCVSDIPWRLK